MRFLSALAALALCTFSLSGNAAALTLSCPDSDSDADRIQQLAPDVVNRTAPHTLQIKTAKDMVSLVDKPPHDDPFSGTHYQFCDRRDGFVLIAMQDESLFTGKLINEATGAVTDGGVKVLLAPDGQSYFVTEQPDGLDGEVWKTYTTAGKALWSGYSFVTRDGSADSETSIELNAPVWQANGTLSVTASCPGTEIHWPASLIRKGEQWSWQPQRQCPAPND